MALPTTPTINKRDPARARILIHGRPKTGKTTFAASWFPKTNLILDCEGGTKWLPGEHFIEPIDSFTKFSNTVDELVAGGHQYDTVTIDTLNALCRVADLEAGLRHGKIAAGLVEYGKGTKDRDAHVIRVLDKLLHSGLGVIMIAHSARTEAEDGSERVEPSLPVRGDGEGLRPYFVGSADYIWYAQSQGPEQVLRTMPNAKYEAGSREPLPDPLPLDPAAAYRALVDAVKPKGGGKVQAP